MPDPSVAQVLRDAADLIERDRDLWSFSGAFLFFWVAEVTDAPACDGSPAERRQLFRDALRCLADHLTLGPRDQALGPRDQAIVIRTWESEPGVTTAEVLAALRACANKEEANA